MVIDCPYCKYSFSPNADINTREQLLKYLTNIGRQEPEKECKGHHHLKGLSHEPDESDEDALLELHASGSQLVGEECALAEEKKDPRKKTTSHTTPDPPSQAKE